MEKSKKKTIIIISVILVIIVSICLGAYCATIWVADKTITTVVNNLYDPDANDENDSSNVVDISSLTESEITNILVTGEIPQELIDKKIQENNEMNESSSNSSAKSDSSKNSYYILTPAQAKKIESSISDQDKIRIIQIAIEALPPDAYQEIYAILTDGGITASNLNSIYAILDKYLDGNQKQEVLALYSKYIYLVK